MNTQDKRRVMQAWLDGTHVWFREINSKEGWMPLSSLVDDNNVCWNFRAYEYTLSPDRWRDATSYLRSPEEQLNMYKDLAESRKQRIEQLEQELKIESARLAEAVGTVESYHYKCAISAALQSIGLELSDNSPAQSVADLVAYYKGMIASHKATNEDQHQKLKALTIDCDRYARTHNAQVTEITHLKARLTENNAELEDKDRLLKEVRAAFDAIYEKLGED